MTLCTRKILRINSITSWTWMALLACEAGCQCFLSISRRWYSFLGVKSASRAASNCPFGPPTRLFRCLEKTQSLPRIPRPAPLARDDHSRGQPLSHDLGQLLHYPQFLSQSSPSSAGVPPAWIGLT